MTTFLRISLKFLLGFVLAWGLCLLLSAPAEATGPTVPNHLETMPNLEGLKLAALSFGRDQLKPKENIFDPETAVPNVVGLSLLKARSRLFDASLNCSNNDITLKTTDQRQQDGAVAAQDPPPGKKVKTFSFVKLTIYKYERPAEVEVPLVVNKSMNEARQLLEQKGFQVTVAKIPVPTRKPDQDGMVAGQSLAGIQKRGTKIELTPYKLLKLPGK